MAGKLHPSQRWYRLAAGLQKLIHRQVHARLAGDVIVEERRLGNSGSHLPEVREQVLGDGGRIVEGRQCGDGGGPVLHRMLCLKESVVLSGNI